MTYSYWTEKEDCRQFLKLFGFLRSKTTEHSHQKLEVRVCQYEGADLASDIEKFEIFLVDGNNEVEFSLVDVKLQARFKRKWVRYAGRRWAVSKTNITTNYIYGKKNGEPPYVKEYEFLDKETWDAFVASRLSEEENAKRLKAQEIQSQNKCPHRCSRGGYEVLTQKMMDEKYKERQQASDDPSAIIEPPSPPSPHETWKRALVKPSGEYINQETSDIAAKIDALDQEQSFGSFTTSGRNDILAVAIGKPDHPSRVRGVGKGYTVRTYSGKKEHAADGMVSREEVAAIIAEMKAEMQSNLRAEMKMILSSQAISAAAVPDTPAGMSGKGSCEPELMPSDQQEEHVGNNVGDCELYVEDQHKRLVAYARIHQLGSNLHSTKLNDDQVLEFKEVRSQKNESTSHCASLEDANEPYKHTRNPLKQ
ncbi:Proteasome subunit beta type-3 [Castilleja foliolosa]|uniref:Proteasome subunit beta type-3 n=1 Tax=Castilleja foliolosa TaxID=1961234 RepID=A0ABD3BNG3_9LAMI